jgi:four helix bundle protein
LQEQAMKDFRRLKVWVKSHHLALKVYSTTEKFSPGDFYGLKNQMRRSSVSIPMDIAGGCGRNQEDELRAVFETARKSASELQYLFLLARDLGLLSKEECNALLNEIAEIKKMLAPGPQAKDCLFAPNT